MKGKKSANVEFVQITEELMITIKKSDMFGFWLFGFYGVTTSVGYLTLNSVDMYIHSTKDYLAGKMF